MSFTRFAVAVLSCLVAAGAARAQPTLERIGQYIPLDAAFVNAAPIFVFADLEAFQRTGRFAAIADPARRWAAIGLPGGVAPVPGVVAALREATGLDAGALQRALMFGQPPDTVLVFSGAPALAEAGGLERALGRRRFARIDERGWSIWHVRDDYQMSLMDREPDDPFGGQFGRSERIAVRGGDVVGTAAWGPLRAVLAAVDGNARSLAGVAEFMAALYGVGDAARGETMAVIEAAGFHVGQTGLAAADPAVLLQGSFDQARAALVERMRRETGAGRLPPYLFAVLGDLAGRDRDGAVIALAYGDEAAAAEAAPLLALRLSGADAPGALAARDARIAGRVVAFLLPVDGRRAWAAVATVTYPIDAQRPAAYRAWLDAIFQRSFPTIALTGQ